MNDDGGYYESDLWTAVGKRYVIPQNFAIYGEIIGWVGESAIQSGYTYDCPKGTNELYVYRVCLITNQGRQIDLPWESVKAFCVEHGMKHVPELARMKHSEFVPENFIDCALKETHCNDCLALSDITTVDEGVCVRYDGVVPIVLKAKSPIFLGHETKLKDKEVEDLEEAQCGLEILNTDNAA